MTKLSIFSHREAASQHIESEPRQRNEFGKVTHLSRNAFPSIQNLAPAKVYFFDRCFFYLAALSPIDRSIR